MEIIGNKMKEASHHFQCHNFQMALQMYSQCASLCRENGFPAYLLHNIQSLEATLRMVIGEPEVALSILDLILRQNKCHWLSLLRRSQIYKKQNQLKKAMNDLELLSLFTPQNTQVAMFKHEIQGLMSKSKEFANPHSQTEKSWQFADYMNLDKNEKASVSTVNPKERKGRVSIVAKPEIHEDHSNRASQDKQQRQRIELENDKQRNKTKLSLENNSLRKARTSCLKSNSFFTGGQFLAQTQSKPAAQSVQPARRQSKFDQLGLKSIDGKMIHKESRFLKQSNEIKEQSNISEDESESGSNFNIFGSKTLDVNKELIQNLGIKSDEIKESETKILVVDNKTSIMQGKQNAKGSPKSNWKNPFSK